MKYIYHKTITLLLSITYKVVDKLELKELELSNNPCPDDYSFYKEAFQLYQSSRSAKRIDDIISNSSSLKEGLKTKEESDKFIKYEEKYRHYSLNNKNKH